MSTSWRRGRVPVAVLIALLATVLLAPTASARSPLPAFTSVDSTPDGCRSTVIAAISGAKGVRYYHDGQRLHFPTRALRFDDDGAVELRAKGPRGAALTTARYRLLAPSACFVDLTVDTDLPRYEPVVSWCTRDPHPYLAQAFVGDPESDEPVVWSLRRRSDRHLVDVGGASIGAGSGETRFPLDAGLRPGRYLLEVSPPIAADGLYWWSMPVEAYRCLQPPKTRPGQVTFTVPRHGPAVVLSLSVPSSVDPVASVRVRAGHAYTFRTDEPEVVWTAYAAGDHVGDLGHGTTAVPPV